jgi:uncharacterized protein YidB (DUF937 family)
MGLLDGIIGGAGGQPAARPGFGDTVAAGAVLALLVSAVKRYQAGRQGAAASPQDEGAPGGGLLGGLLGGGGAGLGGLLASLGGAGALGALVDRFRQKGLGAQAGSWVGTGQNQPIAPADVGHALGENTLQELEARTGLPRDQLLQELAHELPQAVNAATPSGRLPTDDELHEIAR